MKKHYVCTIIKEIRNVLALLTQVNLLLLIRTIKKAITEQRSIIMSRMPILNDKLSDGADRLSIGPSWGKRIV